MARPKAVIDAADVEKLASFGLTNREIGEVVGASEATIGRRFASETSKGRGNLKRSLRRKQVEVALSGNVVMLIWLGKNLLDQKDKQEVDNITLDVSKLSDEQLERLSKNGDIRSILAITGASRTGATAQDTNHNGNGREYATSE